MRGFHTVSRAHVSAAFAFLLVGLLLGGCRGLISFGGDLWLTDDDDSSSANDDDATANDDDATGDDDDATANDDDATGDDDDATGPGGPVLCGPNVAPGSDWAGQSTSAYTGDARVTFDHDARGGFFGAQWTGCEAKHFFDADGEYVCGIKWSVVGPSYGEQYQTTRLVSRFAMGWVVDDNTCAPGDPEVSRPMDFYRITVPYDSGSLVVLVSDDEATVPAQMDDWVELGWDGDGDDEPDMVEFDYSTPFSATP
ncbi:MAG: hypothetical protein KDA24_15000 [Deltaproteobacteria bacterium]|nr:hypothetical protein [Deltaproteobacteria bacterium]